MAVGVCCGDVRGPWHHGARAGAVPLARCEWVDIGSNDVELGSPGKVGADRVVYIVTTVKLRSSRTRNIIYRKLGKVSLLALRFSWRRRPTRAMRTE